MSLVTFCLLGVAGWHLLAPDVLRQNIFLPNLLVSDAMAQERGDRGEEDRRRQEREHPAPQRPAPPPIPQPHEQPHVQPFAEPPHFQPPHVEPPHVEPPHYAPPPNAPSPRQELPPMRQERGVPPADIRGGEEHHPLSHPEGTVPFFNQQQGPRRFDEGRPHEGERHSGPPEDWREHRGDWHGFDGGWRPPQIELLLQNSYRFWRPPPPVRMFYAGPPLSFGGVSFMPGCSSTTHRDWDGEGWWHETNVQVCYTDYALAEPPAGSYRDEDDCIISVAYDFIGDVWWRRQIARTCYYRDE